MVHKVHITVFKQVFHLKVLVKELISKPGQGINLGTSKILMVMVVDDVKDGGADKEADPLDESEGKDCGQDFKSYVVNVIIDDVVEQTFFPYWH